MSSKPRWYMKPRFAKVWHDGKWEVGMLNKVAVDFGFTITGNWSTRVGKRWGFFFVLSTPDDRKIMIMPEDLKEDHLTPEEIEEITHAYIFEAL